MNITKDTIKELSHNLAEPEWLLQKRMSVFRDDLVHNLADQNYGLGLYTKYPTAVFADGDFSVSGAQVSCETGKVHHFDGAVKDKKMSQILKDVMFMRPQAITQSHFSSLTASVFTDGFVVAMTKSDTEYTDVIISSTEEFAMTYVMVIIHKNVSVKIHEHIHVPTTHSVVIEYVILDEGRAEVVASNNVVENKALFISRIGYVYQSGHLSVTDAVRVSGRLQSNTTLYMLEENAQGFIGSAYYSQHGGVCDALGSVVHEAPHTQSRMFARSALADVSKVVYRGYITMNHEANDSHSYQKHDGLMLDDKVIFNAVPNLDIKTHSVTCSHGVTASKFSDLHAFYCMSKGLSYEDARTLYLESFLYDALQYISSDEKKKEIQNIILGITSIEE